MRALWFVALYIGLNTSVSSGQQNSPSTPPPVPDAQPAHVKVYTVGPSVIAPVLIPFNVANIAAGKCKNKVDGKIAFSVLVDETGKPRNIMFLNPLGTELDRIAFQIVFSDRFSLGTRDGSPIVVGQSVEVDLQACDEQKNDHTGITIHQLRLRTQPVQKLIALPQPLEEAVLTPIGLSMEDSYKAAIPYYRVGGDVTAPVVLHFVDPEFTDEARRAQYAGVCSVSLIVDVYGRPQNVQVVRPLDYGLSEKAIQAVEQFRFKPAMKHGDPVPVMVNIDISFRLY